MMLKKLLIPLFCFVLAGVAGAAGPINYLDSIDFPIVETGDTAQVSKITPTLAVMGFGYIDSMSYNADTGDHVTLTWTSPMQAMMLPRSVFRLTVKLRVMIFKEQAMSGILLLQDLPGLSDSS